MKTRVILHKQNILKPVTTKAPPKISVPIANYAAFINSRALSKKAVRRPAVRAQLLLNKQPMLCFIQNTEGLPMIQTILRKKRIQPKGE